MMQAPVVAAPPIVAAPQPQNAIDIVTLLRLLGQTNGGGNGGGGTGLVSDDVRRMNDKLSSIETKLTHVEDLIQNRLNRVEEDVATLQKAQTEVARQLENRLNKTTEDVKENTDYIYDLARAVEMAQLAIAVVRTVPDMEKLFIDADAPPQKVPSGDLNKDLAVFAFDTGEGHNLTAKSKPSTIEWLKYPVKGKDAYLVRWRMKAEEEFRYGLSRTAPNK